MWSHLITSKEIIKWSQSFSQVVNGEHDVHAIRGSSRTTFYLLVETKALQHRVVGPRTFPRVGLRHPPTGQGSLADGSGPASVFILPAASASELSSLSSGTPAMFRQQVMQCNWYLHSICDNLFIRALIGPLITVFKWVYANYCLCFYPTLDVYGYWDWLDHWGQWLNFNNDLIKLILSKNNIHLSS